MRLFFIVFALVAITIVTSAHYFLYLSAVRFFSLNEQREKTILAGALMLFAVGFVVSMIVAHFHGNFIVKIFYFIFAFWYGIIIYFLLAAAILWLLAYLSRIYALDMNLRLLAFVMIAVSLLVSIIGYFNAQRPRVAEHTAALPNLPPSWEGRKIVQISDVHAGIINNGSFLERMVAKINELKPEAVMITGDYFDGTTARYEGLAGFLKNLHAPRGVYFVTGNHETYINMEHVLAVLAANEIRVLHDEAVNLEGLIVVGLDYPTQGFTRPAPEIFKNLPSDRPIIMLYHEPRLIEEAKAAGVNLQLAGHIHRGQIFPYNFITRLIYGKYHYGWHEEENYTLYTSSGTGTWGPPIRTTGTPEIVAITLKTK